MTKARGTESRHDFPRDPAATLRWCRAFKSELGKVQATVTFQGPVYRAIDAINGKIDALAEWLTGEEGYFSRGYASSTSQPKTIEKWKRWDAMERGDEP
jgi:hypothetical protein